MLRTRIESWSQILSVSLVSFYVGCGVDHHAQDSNDSSSDADLYGHNASVGIKILHHELLKPPHHVCKKSSEVCDGVDNDCDGKVDEGSWADFSQGLHGGHVNDVKFDAREPGVVYLTAGSRVYRSEDSGSTFVAYGDENIAGVGTLAFSPDEPKGDLWVSSGSGVWRLAKDAKSGVLGWTNVALDGLGVASLLIDPARPQLQFAGMSAAGLLRSTSSGIAWSTSDNDMPYSQVAALAGDPNDADHVLAGLILLTPESSFSNDGQILETTDAGAHWRVALDAIGEALSIVYCPSDPSIVFAATRRGIAKSNDAGSTWTTGTLATDDVTDLTLAGSDCSTLYAQVYPFGVRRSDDGGATWTPIMSTGITTEFVNGRIAGDPQDPLRVVIGTTDGAFTSSDGGAHFAPVLGVDQITINTLSSSPAAPGVLWMATWGSGAWQHASASGTWQRVSSDELPRDALFTATMDPASASRILIGAGSDIWRSLDAGLTFDAPTIPSSANPTSFTFDATNPSVIYATTQVLGVLKSTDAGASWLASNGRLTPWLTGAGTFIDTRELLIDPTTPSTLLLATNGGGVFRSLDAGSSWTAIPSGLDNKYIECLVRDPAHAQTVYACANDAGAWKSTDNGSSWSPVNSGLPALGVHSLVVDAISGKLYAATDAGVYQSSNAASSWSAFDAACMSTKGAHALAIVTSGSTRRLVASIHEPALAAHPL